MIIYLLVLITSILIGYKTSLELNGMIFLFNLVIASFVLLYPFIEDINLYFKTKKITINYITPISIFSFLFFIYPISDITALEFYSTKDLETGINKSLVFLTLTFTIFWIVYYNLIKRYHLKRFIEPIKINQRNKVANLLLIISSYSIFSLWLPNITNPLKTLGIAQILIPLSLISSFWIIYSIMHFKGILKIFSIILLFIQIIHGLATTQIGYLYPSVLSFFFIFISKKGKIPIVWSIVLVSFLWIALIVKTPTRELTWKKNAPELTIWEKFDVWKKVFNKVILNEEEDLELRNDGKYDDLAKSRLGHIAIFTLVMDKTPEELPYWYGRSYLLLLYKPIPRFLWPDKPIDNIGNQFGKYYGILGEDNNWTSINLPFVMEAYVNFGWLGIFMGIIFAYLIILGIYIFQKSKSHIWKFYGLYLIFSMLTTEINLSMLIGNSILSLPFFYLFNRITK